MSNEMTRRGFIAAGAGALALAACGKAAQKPKASPAAAPNDLSVVQVTTEVAVKDRRLSFALFTNDRRPFDDVGDVVARLRTPDGRVLPPMKAEVVQITLGGHLAEEHEHPEDAAEVHKILVVNYPFDRAGVWQVHATATKGAQAHGGRMAFQVVEKSQTLVPGDKALASQSPTFADHRGVEPICTRDPVCSQHDMTVAQALASGKPSVITFATPKFCSSRTCGPLVSVIEAIKKDTADKVAYVHVEVYKDEGAKEPAPTVTEWGLQTDPWIFFVGADGVVKERWSGAAGPTDTRRIVDKLAAGTL